MRNTPLCSFCNKEEETLLHIFSECICVIYLWQLAKNHDEPITNHFLLIFKLYVYIQGKNIV